MTSSFAYEEQRRRSPPPTYEEATRNDRPPPPLYTESFSQELQVISLQTPSQLTRPHPESIVVVQPGQVPDGQTLTQRSDNRPVSRESVFLQSTRLCRKRLICNCFCSAAHWTPGTCDYELFCFNCLGFLAYLMICAPGVYLSVGCKKLCPDTCGECGTRNTSLMESYDNRDENIASRVFWSCLGPCCCLTCDEDTEVLPCSDPCVKHCGVCTVMKKMMTCYCGSYKLCDYSLNGVDEQAFGFICDCRDVGCHYGPAIG